MKALVMVDDPAQQMLLRSVFEKVGFTGLFCNSAEQGLEQLPGNAFDAIMIDLNLPGKNGLYALKKIRENPRTKETPVVIFTADRSREMLLQCSAFGVSEYLVKPTAPQQLQQKLEMLKRILVIAKDYTGKSSFANVGVDHMTGVTKFTFAGQFSRYSVQQFQNLYTPLLKAQTQDDEIILNLSSVPNFGPAQAEPLRYISEILEPKLPLIIGGRNFGPLLPMVHDVQKRLFMHEADAMKFLNLKWAEEK
ncbi:MAG: response regulator [Spirochaetes bacterium]|nr:response regulator [Spirochaetota bacterium]